MNPQLSTRRILNSLSDRSRDWFRIANRADEADVYIFDEIGYWGTTARDFIEQVKDLDVATINLYVSSIGGDVFDGIAIYNTLRTHEARVVAQVDSMAASIASVIVQAGDTRRMVTGSQMMIHRASSLAWGTAEDMAKQAEILTKQDDIIAGIYAERAGGDADRYLDLMHAETWMNADETIDEGLADELVEPKPSNSEETDDTEPAEAAAKGSEISDWLAASLEIT